MSAITCDNGCGTFFMNGKEYYNVVGKSYEGHSPMCGYIDVTNDDTIVVKLSGDHTQETFREFDIAIFIQVTNSVIIHRLDLFPFRHFCSTRGIKIESYPSM